MTILHIVNKSAFSSTSVQTCFDHCNHQDAVIFIENGVFNAIKNSCVNDIINRLQIEKQVKFFALSEDVTARGFLNKVLWNIQLVDYKGFVNLTLDHSPIQSWY
jgi:tRNA 2-thiouridine synthesizing protein B